jgi:hypothetical protein
MSDPVGSYGFVPWLRRGMVTEITRVDGTPSADPHVPIPITITFNGNLTATAPLALVGPGEVGGLDPNAVIRVFPTRDSYDAEPNYFPLVEFDQGDLPWRYTPARATSQNRLRPWLCLATIREDELVSVEGAGADGRLPVITVRDASALPILAQSWAWAHVQVSGGGSAPLDGAALAAVVAASPERVVSRLLSPRRMEPNARYVACLVPAFERGRLAGLREPVVGDALAPAWTSAQTNVRLPVYYMWHFGTGAGVDFEFLARQLEARPIPPGVGTRPMDVSAPGAALPPAADTPMTLEGALVPPEYQRAGWSGAAPTTFRTELAQLLNRAAELLTTTGGERVIAPPLYGRWHARRERLDLAAGARPPWFHSLNADPRERVPSGLGTQVVQAEQRQLMASAWEQVKGIREANERLRLTQLARAAAQRLFARHIETVAADEMLVVTAPLHAKVLASPTTIAARLAASPVTPGILGATFRRVSRPLGPLGRRIGFAENPGRVARIVTRLNRGELIPAPPPARPEGALSPAGAGAPVLPPWATWGNVGLLRALARWLPILALLLALLAVGIALAAGAGIGIALGIAAMLAAAGAVIARRLVARVDGLTAFAEGRLTPEMMRSAPRRTGFAPRAGVRLDTPLGESPSGPPAPPEPTVGGEARSARAFREATAALLSDVAIEPEPPAVLTAVPVATLRAKLADELHPAKTVAAGVRQRLKIPPGITRQPTEDPVEPVMAAPEFPRPMYAPLAQLASDWLLPGLDKVPPNTTTILKTNQRFVESYMIGLNHEMARELQWNEYPTDLRGSYFRQFWDVAGFVPPATDTESLRDIKRLHEWGSNAPLGANRPAPPASGEYLVLLVRGELLRRYPNTIVYAVKASLGIAGRELGTEERYPLFSGRLQPDVTFFGFDMTAADARGETTAGSTNQGWFFVLQEQPSEPRFGLDIADVTLGGAPARWSDLAWGHLAATEGELAALTYIDLDEDLPDTRSVTAPAGASWHGDAGLGATGSLASHLAVITLQQPMRVAIHGSDMIRST